MAAYLTTCDVADTQAKDPWIGKRVFTQFGTVLKVGDDVVDDEGRAASATASGKDRAIFRVSRVEQTNGNWLRLKGEGSVVKLNGKVVNEATSDRPIRDRAGLISQGTDVEFKDLGFTPIPR